MTLDVPLTRHPLRVPITWGVIVGVVQASSPLAFWWLDPATVYALSLAMIASIYIGFAVSDGRRKVIAVECGVAGVFVVIAVAAPQPVRCQHPLVAAVLRCRRSCRRSLHRLRDRSWPQPPGLTVFNARSVGGASDAFAQEGGVVAHPAEQRRGSRVLPRQAQRVEAG